MKHTIEKRFSRTILAVSIAAIGLSAPLAAQAEGDDDLRSLITPDSRVEIGVGHVDSGSYKFGDYGRGMQRKGEHLIGNVWMSTRGDNNANYLDIVARNLGLDSRSVSIKGGEQGNYGLSFEYDELVKLHSDSFMTPYTGMGSAVLTAPAGWAGTIDTTPGGAINAPVAATNVTTAMMSALAANMKQFNVQTKRKSTGLGVTKQLDGGWDVSANYKREEKDGTKLTGIPLQIANKGTRGTALAPEPINYSTDLFDVSARYADEKLQAQVAYHASIFKNSNQSLTFDNLYYNAVSSNGGNMLTGRLGQMPDNEFHQLNASAGYAISKETRLSGNLSFGRSTQNEAFQPYTTTVVVGQPALPVGSLDGKVETTHLDVKLHTKLTHETALTAGYKYDDRDNKTPINTYNYQAADNTLAANYVTSATQGNLRRNTPLSKTQQVLYADLDYELSKATQLKFGYDYDKITHTFEPTAGDTEHTVKAEVKHSFSDTSSGGLAYAYSDRSSSTYDGALGLLQNTYSSAYLASLCVNGNTFIYNGVVTACAGGAATATSAATTPFLDTPSLRKFFLTDRKRDKLRAFANVAPSEKLDLQFGASYYKERYPEAEIGYGLAKATGWSANFDANWAATEAVNGLFFATFEDYSTDQNGHNGASSATVPAISTLDRQNNTAAFDALSGTVARNDRSLTLGFGFKVKQNDSLDWGANLSHSTTTGSTAFENIGARLTTILPVPDDISRLNRLELFGKYKVQKDLMLNVRYAYEDYNSTDWAWDGQGYTSSTTFIGSGITSPDYRVNVIGASLVYSFK